MESAERQIFQNIGWFLEADKGTGEFYENV